MDDHGKENAVAKSHSDTDSGANNASKGACIEKREALEPTNGTATQTDAYAFVYNRCIESGVDPDKYKIVFKKVQENVTSRYTCRDGANGDWMKWKVQSLLWDYFFRPDSFPAKMPSLYWPKDHPVGASTPTAVPSTCSRNIKVESPIHSINRGHTDTSMARLMKGKAMRLGIDMDVFDAVVQEKGQVAENRFQSESKEWQEWFGDSLVWGFFFKDSPFPAQEPSRLYPLRSSVGVQKPRASSDDKWVKTPLSGRALGEHTDNVRGIPSSAIPIGPAIMSNSTAVTPVPLYAGFERVMEQKAIALGVRREFFQCLQRNRDYARSKHGKCDPQFRAWLADIMTWKSFFKGEGFPGKEPTGTDIHKCDYWTKPRPYSNDGIILEHIMSSEIRNILCTTLVGGKTMSFSRSFPRPIFDGICQAFSRTSKGDFSTIENALRCEFSLKPAGRDDLSKRIQVTPSRKITHSREIVSVLESSFLFIQSWVDGIRKALDSFQQDTSKVACFDTSYFSIAEYLNKYNILTHRDPKKISSPDIKSRRSITSASNSVLSTRGRSERSRSPAIKQGDLPHDRERLVIFGAYKVFINCSETKIKNMAYALLIDSQKSIVEEATHCQIKACERKRDRGDGLTIQVCPVDDVGVGYFVETTDFVNAWVTDGILGQCQTPKVSSFWNDRINAKHRIPDRHRSLFHAKESKHMVDAGTQTGESAAPSIRIPIPLGDPEYDWEHYAAIFGATEVDRVLLEEQVKAEGALRLVLDQDTQDIVSLGEFEERTLLRWKTTKNTATITGDSTPAAAKQLGGGIMGEKSSYENEAEGVEVEMEKEEGEVSPQCTASAAGGNTLLHRAQQGAFPIKGKRKVDSDDVEVDDCFKKRVCV